MSISQERISRGGIVCGEYEPGSIDLVLNEMDGTITASQAARELGTSVPRVVRAVGRLGQDVERGPGGRVRLRPAQLDQLRQELGVTPRAPGLTRTLGYLADVDEDELVPVSKDEVEQYWRGREQRLIQALSRYAA